MITSLPNLLTLLRIVLIPLLIATFFMESEGVRIGPVAGSDWRWVALAVYALAGVTDFFDGLVARMRGEHSNLGRFLDPVADKLLVAAILLMLAGFDRLGGSVNLLAAAIILSREIFVSGLREFLADLRVSVPVSRLAKWKTTIQLLMLGFLLVGDAAPPVIPGEVIGIAGLWAAAVLTMVTGYDYLRAGLRHMLPEAGPEPEPEMEVERDESGPGA